MNGLYAAGIEKDSLGGGGLAAVDMCLDRSAIGENIGELTYGNANVSDSR